MQREAAKFKAPPHLHPNWKGRGPFSMWCIDLVTHLEPPGRNGETTMVVAVCPFSKWVEAAPLVDKSAQTTVQWLHSEIVCRYRVPVAIRVD